MCFWNYLLSKYPDGFDGENWDYRALSEHICFECVKDFRDKPWDLFIICERKDLPFEKISKIAPGKFILDWGSGLTMHIDGAYLRYNNHAPWYFVETYKNDIDWNIESLTRNPNFPFEYLENSPKSYGFKFKSWTSDNRKHYLSNKSLPLNFLEENADLLIRSYDDMRELSLNPIITQEFISKYPKGLNGYQWSFSAFEFHLPLEFILGCELGPWDDFPDDSKGCRLRNILLNPFMTEEFLESNFNILTKEHIYLLFNAKFLTPEFLIKNLERFNRFRPFYGFEINKLAQNKKFSLDFFERYIPECCASYIRKSKNLTWEFVETHPDGFMNERWSARALSSQKWKIDTDKIRFKRQKAIIS